MQHLRLATLYASFRFFKKILLCKIDYFSSLHALQGFLTGLLCLKMTQFYLLLKKLMFNRKARLAC